MHSQFFVVWCFLITLRVAIVSSATFKIEIKLFIRKVLIRLILFIPTNDRRTMIDFIPLLDIFLFLSIELLIKVFNFR